MIPVSLFPFAEMPEGQMVFGKDFAGKAEAACLTYVFDIRSPACTKEAVGLVLLQVILPVVRAYAAVLHAYLPVLISVLNANRADFHISVMVPPKIRGFP
jgi:hypothetical protein